MKGFSIIICTQNPTTEILMKLFSAVNQFQKGNSPHEIIVVDNKSNPPLLERDFINLFLGKEDFKHIIYENKSGLTAARIAGISKAIYDWIIFFDDDNEPAEDYLIKANILIEKYPQVAAWGPGQLSVNYINQSETTFLKKIKWLFQERQYKETFFDNNMIEGSEYYPFGTGLIVRKDVLAEYVERVNAGRYTMSDRKGKNLMSAGDMQIVFTCLQIGFYAGSSHLLKLSHLIDSSKATSKYAVKLIYALNSSQLKAYQEVFPDQKTNKLRITNYDVLKIIYSVLRMSRYYEKGYTRKMYLSKRLGEINARVIAYESPTPFFLRLFEIIINA